MSKKVANQFAKEYLAYKDLYEEYSELIASLIKCRLLSLAIPFYHIDHRCKSTEGLREKVIRKGILGTHYQYLQDVTDLAAVRVVLYYTDDVQRVQDILKNDFVCRVSDEDNVQQEISLKKGYIAQHEIVQLAPKREKLSEYARFKDLLCEVQIKSIMQHAWSNIEHGIGYKPKIKEQDLERSEIRKLFIQNAKLIKKVDENFVHIREKHAALLAKYAEKVERRKLKALPINYDTVRAYLQKELNQTRISLTTVLSTVETAQSQRCHNLLELDEYLSKTKGIQYD